MYHDTVWGHYLQINTVCEFVNLGLTNDNVFGFVKMTYSKSTLGSLCYNTSMFEDARNEPMRDCHLLCLEFLASEWISSIFSVCLLGSNILEWICALELIWVLKKDVYLSVWICLYLLSLNLIKHV